MLGARHEPFLPDVGLLQKLYSYEEALSSLLGSFGIQLSLVAISGGVADAGFYNLPDLTPVTTETVTYSAGGAPVSDTHAGITLRSLLDAAGGVDVTTAKSDILSTHLALARSLCSKEYDGIVDSEARRWTVP